MLRARAMTGLAAHARLRKGAGCLDRLIEARDVATRAMNSPRPVLPVVRVNGRPGARRHAVATGMHQQLAALGIGNQELPRVGPRTQDVRDAARVDATAPRIGRPGQPRLVAAKAQGMGRLRPRPVFVRMATKASR